MRGWHYKHNELDVHDIQPLKYNQDWWGKEYFLNMQIENVACLVCQRLSKYFKDSFVETSANRNEFLSSPRIWMNGFAVFWDLVLEKNGGRRAKMFCYIYHRLITLFKKHSDINTQHIDVKKLKWPTPRHSIFNITLYSFLCFFNAYFNILNFFTLIWKMKKHIHTYLEEITGSNYKNSIKSLSLCSMGFKIIYIWKLR